ncbi:serine/threonine protein kinase [Streptomyces sp. NBC_01351]|uniref:serine/threonine-protein kinase n=1 Tax=Streptomyces sp. NBC_01351 TaxID=2903833 RepID=UPI002E349561|nr:serine/threonine-protein kinase [Streptomyces sp. NBC_01351]
MTSGGEAAGGRLIGDRYFLTERLGSGAMGTVWAGLDRLVDRQVAVKEAYVRTDLDDSTHRARIERILREAKAAARAGHQSVVAVYDVVVEDGRPWIVMERVYGRTLSELLSERGPLDEAEAAAMLVGVAEALVAAHGKGVLHRDIKPSNIMLGEDGRVLLTDFGVAYIQGEPDLTRSGEVMGSVAYMAPERMSGRHQPGPEADLWSLGVVLYEMVEGTSPFRRDSIEGTVAAVLMDAPPRAVRAPVLGTLIAELLAKEPGERTPGAEVVARLRSATEARAVAGADATPAGRDRRRIRMLAGLGAAGLAVVALTLTPTLIEQWGKGGGGGPGAKPSTSSSPSASSSVPPYEVMSGKGFTVEVPWGWGRRPENVYGQHVFHQDDFQLIIVAGRDEAAPGADPVAYQKEDERELEPYRSSSWSSATNIRSTNVGLLPAAHGTYTWTDQLDRSIYARNTVLVMEGRYHVILATGPETAKARVDEIATRAVASYWKTG